MLQAVVVRGQLPRRVRPRDDGRMACEAAAENHLVTIIGAAVIVKIKIFNTDMPIEREPFCQVARLVLKDKASRKIVIQRARPSDLTGTTMTAPASSILFWRV